MSTPTPVTSLRDALRRERWAANAEALEKMRAEDKNAPNTDGVTFRVSFDPDVEHVRFVFAEEDRAAMAARGYLLPTHWDVGLTPRDRD